ncbi:MULTISPECIES: hypothetical protein [unclassified Pantoea]|uniref:hypothetical protein n=1 Tax=unclassified Pantoea TaxID=2630326 RepID=UPI00257E3707|nr:MULTISPECIES: hypothetical protein [unclassified Pantoea]MDU5471869.1 hypothetical protein [Pantoea sp.]
MEMIYQQIKSEFEAVQGILQSLCLDEYLSPDAYLNNFELIQNRYVSLSELADLGFLEWLAERDPELYCGLVRWASTVSTIAGCLANLYPEEEKEQAVMH